MFITEAIARWREPIMNILFVFCFSHYSMFKLKILWRSRIVERSIKRMQTHSHCPIHTILGVDCWIFFHSSPSRSQFSIANSAYLFASNSSFESASVFSQSHNSSNPISFSSGKYLLPSVE